MILVSSSLMLAICCRSVTAAEPRPNFVFLLTDDQRADTVGPRNYGPLETPHIDRLAQQGVRFTNAFVTTSICCISRASYLTGRLARHHQVGDFATPLPAEILATSFPALLHQAGYRTGCLGKWGIGGPEPQGVFDTWHAWGGQGDFFEEIDGQRVHNSQMLAERAEAFLRAGPRDQPFCLLVYYKSPHDPYQPDPRDAEAFRDAVFEFPRTASPEHFATLPEFIRTSEGYTRAQKAHPTRAAYREFVKQYLRCIAGVDRSVGQITQALDELKLADNTVVVYASDNGFFLGEHGMSHKWLMHEESIRVPLIVKDPRLPAPFQNRTLDDLVLNIDVAPTILQMAGVIAPDDLDGRSLWPLLRGQRIAWRDDFFYEHHYHHGGKIPRTEGLRTRDWKYITYFDVEPAYEELYDLAHDPLEERNLAGVPQYREQFDKLKQRYLQVTSELPPPVLPRK
ncbi:MAG: sulfatase [Planctomycetaceae bacterium]|nr:sulfatase [Planctomycetaceae bacterium]